MNNPKDLLYGGVAGLVAIVQPELAPFILIGAGILFILFRIG
jgi:hypothetical protein